MAVNTINPTARDTPSQRNTGQVAQRQQVVPDLAQIVDLDEVWLADLWVRR
jgi:hypothetical protein